ncbi:MAG: hypothetical protein Q9184_005559 [Pyrenodesmia sp. 2 TL-2023]
MATTTRISSLDRTRNSTRITMENIISADTLGRLTRRGSRETPASTYTVTGTPIHQSRGRIDIPQPRIPSADISTDNIIDSPDAARLTRRGSAGHVSATRAPSNRQQRRYDPATRVGRLAWLENRPERTRRRRVRFAVALTRAEARDLLEQADRMSAERAGSNGPQENEETSSTDQDGELAEDTPIAPLRAGQNPSHSNNDFELYEEAAAAVEQSMDPIFGVIQRLAVRAAADPALRALMRVVAAGNALQDDLDEFQSILSEIEELNKVTQQSQGGSGEVAASDSSSEPESDTSDKENVPPVLDRAFPLPHLPRAPPQAPQNNNPPTPSRGTIGSLERRRFRQRYALEEIPTATPTESSPDDGSGPQALSGPPPVLAPPATPRGPTQHPGRRPRFTSHEGASPRFRRGVDHRLERIGPRLAVAGSPIRGLGSVADYLPVPTPPRSSPLGATPPSMGSRISSPRQVADGRPEMDAQSQVEGERLPRGHPGLGE